MAKTYFIKDGYRPNTSAVTREGGEEEFYWTASRLKMSYRYQFPVYRLASQLMKENGFHSVVDVGCGVATKLAELHKWHPAAEIVGIDQPHAIAFCQQHWNFGTWIADDFENPATEHDSVRADLVICADVVEHLEDPDILLAYLKKRVTERGLIAMSTPERDLLRGVDCDYSPNPYHVREWNASEFARYLESSGFEIVSSQLQLPVRPGFDRTTKSEILTRWIRGKPLRYNQVVVLRSL